MKKALVFSALTAAAVSVMAQSAPAPGSPEMGRVVRTVPVVQQVPVNAQGGSASRTVGYDVTYEYAGRQYTTRMASDPGSYIQVGGAGESQPQEVAAQSYTQPGPVEQGVVVGAGEAYATAAPVVYAPAYAPVYAPPVYAAPYPYPYYGGYGYGYGGVPISLSLGFGFGHGYGGGRGHWR